MIDSVIHFFFSMWIVLENINIINGKYIIYRHLWNAREETGILPRFQLPIQYYHISVRQTKVCNTIESCNTIVYEIQDEHMTKNGWHDISYNFLIDGLGHIYEGTGWYTRAIKREKEFLSICLFGIKDVGNPPKEFLDGLQYILQLGKEFGYLSQVAKPLFNFNKLTNMTERFWQTQRVWKNIISQDTNDSSPNDDKNQKNNVKSPEIVSNVDWSKVFPNLGNRTALDNVMSDKQTIEKANWNKVFRTPNEVASIDWSTLLRHSSVNQVNWSKIFNNDNFHASNLNSFLSSSESWTNRRLGHNNDW